MTDAFQMPSLEISSNSPPQSHLKGEETGLTGGFQIGADICLNRTKVRSFCFLPTHKIGHLCTKWTFNPWKYLNRIWTDTWPKVEENPAQMEAGPGWPSRFTLSLPLWYIYCPPAALLQGRMELGLIFRCQMTKETILLRPYSIIQAEVCKVYVCDCISKICLLFLNHWFQFSKSQPLPLMWLSFNYNVSSLLLI